MGSVTLHLPPPAGQCDLVASEPGDSRVIAAVTKSTAAAGNDLLVMTADCQELVDWRAGRRPLLEHLAQYQVQTALRGSDFALADALAACADVKARGSQINRNVVPSTTDAVHTAAKKIELQEQSYIGVLADDTNGCYVALLQRIKAETGKQVVRVNVFFLGSIARRELFFYMMAPYVDESSVTDVLAKEQAHIAQVKALNP